MRRTRALTALALAAALALGACQSDEPEAPVADATEAAPTPTPEPKCPLTGADAPDADTAERPAVAVKVENNPSAYPLSGLADAEIVYEELVEGGITRFLALYHCTDAKKVGPVRSARVVDPGIMGPITRILGAAGGNAQVRRELDQEKIVLVDENSPGKAMRRISRAGISLEHTLYASTVAIRQRAQKRFDDPPPEDLFTFGDLEGKASKARSVTMRFSPFAEVTYRWGGDGWKRFDRGEPLPVEGKPIQVDNVVIEQHTVNYSKTIVDVNGNPSIEIADKKGAGLAILLRDGQAIKGSWRRDEDGRVTFETKGGDPMVFKPGTIWIELIPDKKGEIKGSFSISKK